MTAESYENAVALLKAGVEKETAKDYAGALAVYKQGIGQLMLVARFETNEKTKAHLCERIKDYISRCEELKRRAEPVCEASEEHQKLRASLGGVILREAPNVRWSDIIGLEEVKRLLREATLLPLRSPHLFTLGGRKPWRGILLYGPPGTGKSMLAKAVATEIESAFFSASSADLVSKYVGESERLVKELFEMARASRPAIIFLDEIDALCSERGGGDETESSRRLKTQFLAEMDGVGKSTEKVLVLAATNLPHLLDDAFKRRFEKMIFIPPPGPADRAAMLRAHLGQITHALTDEDFAVLGEATAGFTGSDLSRVVKDASMEPIRRLQDGTTFRRDAGGAVEVCKPGDPGAFAATFAEVAGEVVASPVTRADFDRVLVATQPAVDVSKYQPL